MRLGLDQKSQQEMRGNQDQKKQRDQKKWRCLGDYLLEDFEGKVILAAILWRWRRTGPEAVLKVTQRTGPGELSSGIDGAAILDKLVVHPLVHYGGD